MRDAALVWSGDKFRSGPFPFLLHSKEKWPSDQENIAKPRLIARTGMATPVIYSRFIYSHFPGLTS